MKKKWRLFQAIGAGFTVFMIFASQSYSAFAAFTEEKVTPYPIEPSVHFSHITSDDGLVQNSIEAILQDRQGFMWFGTPNGLSRYDGYRFTNFQNDREDPNSLRGNWVHDLLEDQDGMIWVATEGGGVSEFDPTTEIFSHYLPDAQNPNSIAGDRVSSLFHDSAGNFWFLGLGFTGLNKFNPATGIFTRYPADPQKPDGFKGGTPKDVEEDAAGNLWMASVSVLAKYDPLTNQFSYYTPPEENGRKEDNLVAVHIDSNGSLWVGGHNGLYQFDPQGETFIHFPARLSVNDLLEDESGNFWVASDEGLYWIDPRAQQILGHFRNDPARVDSLSENRIRRLYQDREGVLWLGTNRSGINIFDPHQMQFLHYRHDSDSPSSISDGPMSAIYASDSGQVWVGIGNTLDLIDLNSRQVTHYPLEIGPRASISAVFQDHDGMVWVGASGLRLYRFDPATAEFALYPFESMGDRRNSSNKNFVGFYEDRDEDLWIAVDHDGLYRFDPSHENIQFYQSPKAPDPPNATVSPINPPRLPITSLYGDHAGNIWVTTLNGFFRFEPQNGTFQPFRPRVGNIDSSSYMESLFEDREGLIWVASRDGLIRVDPDTQEFRYYTEKDGLPDNYVVSILEDKDGNLWLGTKGGLSRFSPGTEIFRNYDASDGLQGNEFNSRLFAQTPDGLMIFGGENGLTVFDPETIRDNLYAPPIVFTDFELFNKPVWPGSDAILQHPISETSNLTLNHDQNILSFEFSALSYAAPRKNLYRYKLDGFESDWNETTSSRRFVTYTNLPAGSYTLRVQGTNNSGIWSDQEAALALTILPPWWETTWFRVVALLALVALILSGYQWRVRTVAYRNRELENEVARQTFILQERTYELQASEGQLRHAKEAAEAANRAKSTFLANMSHELRSPLNVILGFAQVTNRSRALSHEAHENLDIILRSSDHLLTLINQVLDLSKIEAGRMTLNETSFDLYRLLDDLDDMFSLKADDKNLTLIFDRFAGVPQYLYGDGVKLRQVLINLIGNALKFTETGAITVRVMHLDLGDSQVQLQFEIEDTGPGIFPEELSRLFKAFTQTEAGRQSTEGTGLGLTISREFIRMMGGEISVKSHVGLGTTFAFSIRCQVLSASDALISKTQRHVVALEPGQPIYRILVVDDKWTNRQLLMRLLKPLGFDLREAENGEVAVNVAQVFRPHLIFMDMRMPEMNGLEATRRIKSTPYGQSMVIVALTASAFEEDRSEIIKAGCDDFVRKPFRMEEIFNLLGQHIGVRYVYAQDDRQDEIPIEPMQFDDLRSAMNPLPSDLRARFSEGVELGDIEMLDNVIAEIAHHSPGLAESLARLANQFEYDKLSKLVQETAQ